MGVTHQPIAARDIRTGMRHRSNICKEAFSHVNAIGHNVSCPAEEFKQADTCWSVLPAGKSETLICGTFYDVLITRHCQEDGVWSLSEKEIDVLCHQPASYGYIHPFLYFGLLPVSIAIVFIAIFILAKLSKLRKTERTLRLYLLVLIATFVSLVVLFITNLLMSQLYDRLTRDTVLRLCIASNLLDIYFIEVRNFWLFNVGIYLIVTLLRPLKHYHRIIITLHAIGWLLPCLPIATYFVTLGVKVNWEMADICQPPQDTYHYLYIIEGPSMLTYLFDFIAVIIVLRILRQKLRFPAPHTTRLKIGKEASRTFRTFIWLFGLMGQWKVFLLVPVWDLKPRARFFYSLWILFVNFLSSIAITVPTCFYNNDVRQQIRKYFRLRKEISAMTSANRHSSQKRSDNFRRRGEVTVDPT